MSRLVFSALLTVAYTVDATAANSALLALEGRIPMGEVRGRIDHLAIDTARDRLYVAELDNNSVGVVDLGERKTLVNISGLKEPQGIGYVPSTDTVYVANASDGTVQLFQGTALTPAGEIALGSDADNIRVDDITHRLYVGYGDGALAVIDTASRRKLGDIPVKSHPESFQLEPSGPRIFVNEPDARRIGVVNRTTGVEITTWPTSHFAANFPMALDPASGAVVAVFRHPPTLGLFDMQTGRLMTSLATCGDSDDVFLDAKRRRLYVICGEGFIEVFGALQPDGYASLGRVATVPGARTALFAPAADRLMLAVPAHGNEPASIWLFRPSP